MLRLRDKHKKQLGLAAKHETPILVQKGIDCRKCLHFPKMQTTGILSFWESRTHKWSDAFCGSDPCSGRKFQELGKMAVFAPGDDIPLPKEHNAGVIETTTHIEDIERKK